MDFPPIPNPEGSLIFGGPSCWIFEKIGRRAFVGGGGVTVMLFTLEILSSFILLASSR